MSADDFRRWLEEMRTAGLSESDADAARQLGKSVDRIWYYKQHGADMTVALACRALVHRMAPYGMAGRKKSNR